MEEEEVQQKDHDHHQDDGDVECQTVLSIFDPI